MVKIGIPNKNSTQIFGNLTIFFLASLFSSSLIKKMNGKMAMTSNGYDWLWLINISKDLIEPNDLIRKTFYYNFHSYTSIFKIEYNINSVFLNLNLYFRF